MGLGGRVLPIFVHVLTNLAIFFRSSHVLPIFSVNSHVLPSYLKTTKCTLIGSSWFPITTTNMYGLRC